MEHDRLINVILSKSVIALDLQEFTGQLLHARPPLVRRNLAIAGEALGAQRCMDLDKAQQDGIVKLG